MNNRRIASLYRQLADEFDAEADAQEVAPPPAPKSAPKRRAKFPVPEQPVNELDRARARRELGARGMVSTKS